jgi:hypothetical protein
MLRFSHGTMEDGTRENINMIRSTAMEFSNGLMGEY